MKAKIMSCWIVGKGREGGGGGGGAAGKEGEEKEEPPLEVKYGGLDAPDEVQGINRMLPPPGKSQKKT